MTASSKKLIQTQRSRTNWTWRIQRLSKLLVVEDDLEDEQLLCEALIEIEENRQWCNWRSASIVQVDQLADALDCLRRESLRRGAAQSEPAGQPARCWTRSWK